MDKIEIIRTDKNYQISDKVFNKMYNNMKLNAVMLGCDNTGNTDCTDIINSNLKDNVSIYFPKGTYLINGIININGLENIEICGDGNLSKLLCTNGSINNGNEILNINASNFLYIHDIALENTGYGNGENQKSGQLVKTGACIILKNCDYIVISNTYTSKGGGVFNGVNQGIGNIYLSRCRYALITNNTVKECENGICIDDWITGENNTFDIIISNNIVDNGNGRGIVLDTNSEFYFNGIIVSSNKISNFGYSGIDVKGTTSSLIIGNIISGKASNKYYPSASLLDTYYGIQIDFNDNNSQIIGNHIQWTQCGILLANFQNVFIKDNYIEVSNHSEQANYPLFINNAKKCRIDLIGNTIIDNSNKNCIVINNTAYEVEIHLLNNIIQGNLCLLSGKTSNLDTIIASNNVFIGNLGVSLSGFKLLELISNSIRTSQFVNISGDVSIFDGNIMNGCDIGYRFYGNNSFVDIKDTFVGDITTVLFSTKDSTIANGRINNMNILLYNDESYSKIKDGGGLLFGRYFTSNKNALINDNDTIILKDNSDTFSITKTSAGNKKINYNG